VSGGPHEIAIRGTPEQVWAFLWDADALARVLPGCDSISAEGPGRYRAAIRVRVPLFTVRGDVVAELHDPVAPREVALTLDGTTRGLGGTIHVRLPIALEPTASPDGALTLVRYDVEVVATGAIGAFGPSVLRDALVDEVAGLAVNIEREIAAGRVPDMAAP
jgi:carbon monoxide dehydrogenase subunit G